MALMFGISYFTMNNLLEHIKSHILSHGYPPSIRELMAYTGMSSTNTVWRALRDLEASGAITVEPGQSRAIRLNGYGMVLIGEEERYTNNFGVTFYYTQSDGFTPLPYGAKRWMEQPDA